MPDEEVTTQNPGEVSSDPIGEAIKKFEAETPPDDPAPVEDESPDFAPPDDEKKEEPEPEPEPEPEAESEEETEPEEEKKEKEEEVEAKTEEEEEPAAEEEEKEKEKEDEAELVSIELPEALREQGVDAIEVAPEDERFMRALVNDYEGRKTREANERDFEQVQERLAEDWIQGNTIMAAAPLRHAIEKLRVTPEAVMDEIKLHFLENPHALKDLLAWHDRMEEVEERPELERRTLQDRRESRFRDAQTQVRERYSVKQEAMKVDAKLQEIVHTAIDDSATRERMMNLARQQVLEEIQQREQAGKMEMIRPDEVEGLVGWLIEPYKTKREEPKTAVKEPPQKKAEKTRKRFETRAKRHDESAKKPRSATGQIARGGPRKGETLDQVMERLKKTVT
ncbi:MAG: hypothetical protein GTO15_06425 [Pseudomonas stutzeri]|nr:hypothetical protein [Stutzerimonas stutzeri]